MIQPLPQLLSYCYLQMFISIIYYSIYNSLAMPYIIFLCPFLFLFQFLRSYSPSPPPWLPLSLSLKIGLHHLKHHPITTSFTIHSQFTSYFTCVWFLFSCTSSLLCLCATFSHFCTYFLFCSRHKRTDAFSDVQLTLCLKFSLNIKQL